jgi:hypothetical protein
MTNQIKDANINKLSVQYGLLIGGISVVLSVVYLIIDPLFQYTNWWVGIFTFIVMTALLVILALDIRKKIGGYWSYGEAFKSLIIIAIFTVLISTIYNFVIFKFVDPGLPAKISSVMLDKTSAMLEKFGTEQSKIDEATKQFQNGQFEATLKPTLINELKSVGFGLIFYAIIDLIIAACVKKKAPLFAPPVEGDPTI